MIKILIGFLFISLSTIIYLIIHLVFQKSVTINKKLDQIKDYGKVDVVKSEKKESFYQRFFKKYIDKVIGLFSIGIFKYLKNILVKKIKMTGVYNEKDINKKIVKMISFGVALGILASLISYIFLDIESIEVIKIYFLTSLLYYLLSYIRILSKINKRKAKISKSLPDIIDTISVSVEAGLSFDGSVNRMVNSIDAILVDEFEYALKQMRLGVERKIALKQLGDRCGVEEVSTFISAINQSEELGVSISNILKVQSKDIRQKRYQKIREKSMKAPVKLLFPIVLFIFPSIFYVLLGPAIIKLMEFF
ncbi:MAG: type II secretion system F family protein [Bacillota bacterium]